MSLIHGTLISLGQGIDIQHGWQAGNIWGYTIWFSAITTSNYSDTSSQALPTTSHDQTTIVPPIVIPTTIIKDLHSCMDKLK